MRARLAELAKTSSKLRAAVLIKKSGLLGNALSFVGKQIPTSVKEMAGKGLKVGLGTLGAVAGVQGARGNFKQFKTGFDPNVQRAMLGDPQTSGGG